MHLLGARIVTAYFIKYKCIQLYNNTKGGSMDQIWSVIGQYAFPIVACVVMGWYVKYIQDNYRKDISDISTRHKEEMDKVTTALNNNTLAIQRLTDYIEKDND